MPTLKIRAKSVLKLATPHSSIDLEFPTDTPIEALVRDVLEVAARGMGVTALQALANETTARLEKAERDAKIASTLLPLAYQLDLPDVAKHLQQGDIRSAIAAAEMKGHPSGPLFVDQANALVGQVGVTAASSPG